MVVGLEEKRAERKGMVGMDERRTVVVVAGRGVPWRVGRWRKMARRMVLVMLRRKGMGCLELG